jgi:phage terminase large subunit-like protein
VTYQFSPDRARFACNFFERVLRHTSDQWAGKPFVLAPWQKEAISTIFGTLKPDGTLAIELAYLEVPKKTGKTEMVAGIILLSLFLDTNLGCQVYGAAAAQRQALNVYRAASTMVSLSPVLQKRFKVLASTHRILKRSDPNSFYSAIAADGDLTDGVNPAVTVADEVHRWKTRKQLENFDVLSLGGITRKQTLTIAITTAGVQDESPLAWRLHEKTLRICQGIVEDPTFYGKIYAADAKDDWTKEATWIKANPSLLENGGFLDIEKIRKEYRASLSDPDAQRAFKRYFLNLWDQKENRVIDLAQWDSCKCDWRAQPLLPKSEEQIVREFDEGLLSRFRGRRCWAGVDLSMTTDMSAVAFVFEDDDGFYDVLPFYWLPENGLPKRELRDGMPYRRWADEGYLELSTGNVIDYREVKARLIWGSRKFDLREICFDPYNSRQLSTQLMDEGYECVEIRQGYATLSEPSKKILELVASGKLRHGGHPILRWNASCLSTKESNDCMMFAKPQRQKDSSRIDGISATTDAMARAMLSVPVAALTIDAW